ncbi:MAG: hypothetical protein C5B47_04575 [Verrucomicrobia bacterium]|nr:MAG: hypothetical protein C5B47_04575 [Verrucomicrobiota bacterium]
MQAANPRGTSFSQIPDDSSLTVDVIIPAYRERPEALDATLRAVTSQVKSANRILVVDDCSPEPVVLPDWAAHSPQIVLIRLQQNRGTAGARNAAIRQSDAAFLACVNTEILPDPDWSQTCLRYLIEHPQVGACYTRTDPIRPDKLLTRWRFRFQEPRFGDKSGPAEFAHGHAAFFRRAAFDAVNGYSENVGTTEDSDICERLWKIGWESHYIAESRSVSIQQDTLRLLASKQLRDNGWKSSDKSSLYSLFLRLSKWTLVRAGRNVVKGRFYFLPIDVGLWACALWMAGSQKLARSSSKR